jgi:hypothetical protein
MAWSRWARALPHVKWQPCCSGQVALAEDKGSLCGMRLWGNLGVPARGATAGMWGGISCEISIN